MKPVPGRYTLSPVVEATVQDCVAGASLQLSFVLNSAYCTFPPLIKAFLFLKRHVLFVDLTVAGKAPVSYF